MSVQRDVEDQVDFVPGVSIVIDVAVLDHCDHAEDRGTGAEFFGDFADECGFDWFAWFYVPAG
ncbi:hypothetical protein FG87_31190 [Nocardia vulneris]|uniref:Transposase n=1 Tax=Nocardia vulneris TaxID=1141657 RepID=A0ABR4Z894_9NOCA|nr:hypothetical protein FG87_31190 [Nocardia vulneris]